MRRFTRPAAAPPMRRYPLVPDVSASAQDVLRQAQILDDHVLTYELAPGDVAYVRRSSLIYAEGDFGMTTCRIASRAFPLLGLFSGQNLWANRFEAESPVKLIAGRDFHGIVLGLEVTADMPVWLQPALYLGHRGALQFTVKRVAKREFWTLTKVSGEGTVWIKAPGRIFEQPLDPEVSAIVDTNYVSAIRGRFDAHGRVFTSGQYLRSGEAENVRLRGEGDVLIQTELPVAGEGGGGLFGTVLDIFI